MYSTTTLEVEGYCPHCSNPPSNYVYHNGVCPKVKAVEYHPDGTIKRIEYKEWNYPTK